MQNAFQVFACNMFVQVSLATGSHKASPESAWGSMPGDHREGKENNRGHFYNLPQEKKKKKAGREIFFKRRKITLLMEEVRRKDESLQK